MPLLRTQLVVPDAALRSALAGLASATIRAAVFITRVGARSLLDAADAQGVGREAGEVLAASSVLALTADVRAELEARSIPVHWSPETPTTDEIASYLSKHLSARDEVVVVRDDGEEGPIIDAVQATGAQVHTFELYRSSTNTDAGVGERLIRLLCDGHLDAITFSTRNAVDEFVRLAHDFDLVDEVARRCASDLVLFAIGPVSCAAARAAGIGTATAPEVARIGSLVEHITHGLAARISVLSFPDGQLRLQGSNVWIDGGTPIELSARERGLLAVLARRPGAVWSKSGLLEEVWGTAASDPHAVEVAIARLRKRLSPAGHWIRTVPRRGYSLAVVGDHRLTRSTSG